MRIERSCLILLVCVLARCASSVASAPTCSSGECEALLREVVIENIELQAHNSEDAVRARYAIESAQDRAAKAEAVAKQNDWMARWGLPIGAVGTAAVWSVVMIVLEGLKK